MLGRRVEPQALYTIRRNQDKPVQDLISKVDRLSNGQAERLDDNAFQKKSVASVEGGPPQLITEFIAPNNVGLCGLAEPAHSPRAADSSSNMSGLWTSGVNDTTLKRRIRRLEEQYERRREACADHANPYTTTADLRRLTLMLPTIGNLRLFYSTEAIEKSL